MLGKVLYWSVYAFYFALAVFTVVWLVILIQEARRAQSALYGATEARAEAALANKGDIRIGVAGPWSRSDYKSALYGIRLGIEDANATGGIHGRKIVALEQDDAGDPGKARNVAQLLAEDKQIGVVIGHIMSSICLDTASVYNYYGMVMISPKASTPRLTREGRRRVFRTVPSDEQIGHALVAEATRLGARSALIYHVNDDYGMGLANAFHSSAEEAGIRVPDRFMYDAEITDFELRQQLDRMKRFYTFDMMLLAGRIPCGARIITTARQQGIRVPIMCGDPMDNTDLIGLVGENGSDVIIGSTFDPESSAPIVQSFVARYQAKYGSPPDMGAAQGYDTALLVADAMRNARTQTPDDIAAAIRLIRDWEGVTGIQTMKENGDIEKSICLKTIRDGRLVVLPPDAAIHTVAENEPTTSSEAQSILQEQ